MTLTKIVSTQHYNELEISFWPTDVCNFNCPYCFPGSTSGKYRWPKSLDLVMDKFEELFTEYKKHYKTKFNLTIAGGGEPTLWPQLDEFCKSIKQLANVNISLVTNGSRTLRWWENNAKYIDEAILSCHVHEVDIEHFINVADTLYERDTEVLAMMLMDAKKWDQCVEYIDSMLKSDHPWNITAKPIVSSPGRDIDSYNQEQKDYIQTPIRFTMRKDVSKYKITESIGYYGDLHFPARTGDYIVAKQNFFEEWQCNMPLERIAVDAGLNIKGSCGLTFNKIDSIKCTKHCCSCQPDTHITKWRP